MDPNKWRKRVAGHRQRQREKFLRHGLSVFAPDEVLEILLSFGTPRQDCKERARKAIKKFGSLPAVLEASLKELQDVPGIGPNNAFAVKFVHEVARQFLKERIEGKTYIKAAQDVVDYLHHSLSSRKKEIFVVIFLDAGNAIIKAEEMFEGTLNASAVYPREIIKKALQHHAVSLILAHNHPSGRIEPSEADKDVTLSVAMAAALLKIKVLDHIIIGSPGLYFSFANEGLMDEIHHRLDLFNAQIRMSATPF